MLSPTAVTLPNSPVATHSPSVVTDDHLVLCFDTIVAHCKVEVPQPLAVVSTRDKYPLFITWKKRPHSTPAQTSFAAAAARTVTSLFSSSSSSSSTPSPSSPSSIPLTSYRLRGCIGTFSPKPLPLGLREYALTSAFHDHRFSPISPSELPLLHCSVSLLTSFTPCQWDDWQVGVHGITIQYRGVSATYLPEVAEEQGWGKEETIEELMRKGGWEGEVGEKERREMKVTRYQSQKRGMGWDEYQVWKVEERKRRGEGGGAAEVDKEGAGKLNGKRSRKEEDEEEEKEDEDEDDDDDAEAL